MLLKTKWESFLEYYISCFYFSCLDSFLTQKLHEFVKTKHLSRHYSLLANVCVVVEFRIQIWPRVSGGQSNVDGWPFRSVGWLWSLKRATSWRWEGYLAKWNTTLSQLPCSRFNHGKFFPSAVIEIITLRIKHGIREQPTRPCGTTDKPGLTWIISLCMQCMWKGLQIRVLSSPFGMNGISPCSHLSPNAGLVSPGSTQGAELLTRLLSPFCHWRPLRNLINPHLLQPRDPFWKPPSTRSSFSPPVTKPLDSPFRLTSLQSTSAHPQLSFRLRALQTFLFYSSPGFLHLCNPSSTLPTTSTEASTCREKRMDFPAQRSQSMPCVHLCLVIQRSCAW